MTRLPRLPLAIALLLTALGGCDDATGPIDVTGRYVLESVNGHELPALVDGVLNGENSVEVTAGELTVQAGGACSSSISRRVTTDGATSTEVETEACTWTLIGQAMIVTFSNGEGASGFVDGSLLSLTFDLLIYRYRL